MDYLCCIGTIVLGFHIAEESSITIVPFGMCNLFVVSIKFYQFVKNSFYIECYELVVNIYLAPPETCLILLHVPLISPHCIKYPPEIWKQERESKLKYEHNEICIKWATED